MYDLIPERLSINNPVMAASGTFGYGVEFAGRMDLSQVGAIVCKGVTKEPRAGHAPPRLLETAAGMLNAVGLANLGIEAVVAEKAPHWSGILCPVLVNINGESVDEYQRLAQRLDGVEGVAGVEVNISCPNVEGGGMAFGSDPAIAAEVTRAVRSATSQPLLIKLTPNTDDIVAIAEAVVDAGAEGLTIANTYLGLSIDADHRAVALTNVTGGLSGPAVKPLTLRLVYEIAQKVSVPVIGCGGVMTGVDAVEYLLAGASAVQVGTASLVDPFAVPRIASELRDWFIKERVVSPRDIVGAANPARRSRVNAKRVLA